jgi:hypothetical protein
MWGKDLLCIKDRKLRNLQDEQDIQVGIGWKKRSLFPSYPS